MKRRAFLALPLAARRAGARARRSTYPRVGAGRRAARSRATTAAIRSFAPSGGTSPAGSTRRARQRATASRSRSSATARASPKTIPARSRRGSSCSRTPRSPMRGTGGCGTTSAPRARASASPRRAEDDDRRVDRRLVAARAGDGYAARIAAREFALDLRFAPTQPLLLQGDGGYSRKGPRAAAGELLLQPAAARGDAARSRVDGRRRAVTRHARGSITSGRARSWRADAVGWDWIGINLDDGGALMAFRCATATARRSGPAATLRDAGGQTRDVRAGRRALHAAAPLALAAHRQVDTRSAMALGVGGARASRSSRCWTTRSSTRARSTGTIYWEGAVRAQRGRARGRAAAISSSPATGSRCSCEPGARTTPAYVASRGAASADRAASSSPNATSSITVRNSSAFCAAPAGRARRAPARGRQRRGSATSGSSIPAAAGHGRQHPGDEREGREQQAAYRRCAPAARNTTVERPPAGGGVVRAVAVVVDQQHRGGVHADRRGGEPRGGAMAPACT